MIEKVCDELIEGGYEKDTSVAVVYHASWPDEKKITGTLENISEKVKLEGVTKTALIIVGNVTNPKNYDYSKLYDKTFEHEYRSRITSYNVCYTKLLRSPLLITPLSTTELS